MPEPPNGNVESENGGDEGGGSGDKERKGKGKGERGRRKIGKKKSKGGKKRKRRKKGEPGRVNDPTVCKDVQNRVLRRVTEEAGGDQIFGNKILVPHAARGSKSVIDERKVMEEEGGGEGGRSNREGSRNGRKAGGRGGEKRLVGRDKRNDLRIAVRRGLGEEIISDEGLVNRGAGELGEGDEGAILEMAAAPEINGRGITVIAYELTTTNTDRRKEPVIGGGGDEGGARSEERDVEGPEVFERGTDGKEKVERDQGAVRVGAAVEGGNCFANKLFEGTIVLRGEDKKKEVVRKEGNDENVDEENA